jgi:hypothetical protein
MPAIVEEPDDIAGGFGSNIGELPILPVSIAEPDYAKFEDWIPKYVRCELYSLESSVGMSMDMLTWLQVHHARGAMRLL